MHEHIILDTSKVHLRTMQITCVKFAHILIREKLEQSTNHRARLSKLITVIPSWFNGKLRNECHSQLHVVQSTTGRELCLSLETLRN